MQRRAARWRVGRVGIGMALALLLAASLPRLTVLIAGRPEPVWKRLPRASVRRADIWATVTAGGTVESTKQTFIECALESLDVGVQGNRIYAGGASTILSVVPEGTTVKEGDVLCQLDSSAYEELLYQQEMTVQRSRSDHRQAELNLDVAQTAVQEFRDGLRIQMNQEFDGKIALARSEWERTTDRLMWANRMLAKGYIARGQVSADTLSQQRAAYTLAQSRLDSEVFRRYEVPRTIRELENITTAAEMTLRYQDARLERNQGRLDNIKRQIEHCTIRAPHQGWVVYARDPMRQVVIMEGMVVRQKQRLFTLPDLSRMQVSAMLHESVVDQVREGMHARIHVEGLPDHVLEGHVVSIALLASRSWFSDVPYYAGLVKIDSVPKGLRPGMTAEVKIATARRSDVLTIPASALAVEDGQEVCYVADRDSLERREVKVGEASHDQLEVTRGLNEGEEVVLDPSSIDPALRNEDTPPLESETVGAFGSTTPAS